MAGRCNRPAFVPQLTQAFVDALKADVRYLHKHIMHEIASPQRRIESVRRMKMASTHVDAVLSLPLPDVSVDLRAVDLEEQLKALNPVNLQTHRVNAMELVSLCKLKDTLLQEVSGDCLRRKADLDAMLGCVHTAALERLRALGAVV